jgi:hypothetical protein
MSIKLFLLFGIMLSGIMTHADSLRIEAEDIPLSGKWAVNHKSSASQRKFIRANLKGENNALKLVVDLPKSGKYTIWVRAYSHGQGYRSGELIINGKSLNHKFGDEQVNKKLPDWVMTRGGSVELNKGKNTISILPLSRYFRLDTIILTTDDKLVIPNDKDKIENIPALLRSDIKSKKILVFHGGRPWTGRNNTKPLQYAGADYKLVGSKYLAGLGGAPIRKKLSEKYEPPAKDGITPAFKQLSDYKVIIVAAILQKAQDKFFTPDRIKKLNKWINAGGVLIVTQEVSSKLNNILPVTIKAVRNRQDNTYVLAKNKIFSDLPAKWSYFGQNKKTIAKKNAIVLAEQYDKNGKKIAPYISYIKMGKGKVVYWNTGWRRQSNLKQLMEWAYFGTVTTRIISLTADIALDYKKLIERDKRPPNKLISSAVITVAPPKLTETISEYKNPAIKENNSEIVISLQNGVVLKLKKKELKLYAYYPSIAKPVIRGMSPPKLKSSGIEASELFDKSSMEAVIQNSGDMKTNLMKTDYSYLSYQKETDGAVVIKLDAKNSKDKKFIVEWRIKAGTFNVNSKIYHGFADKFTVKDFKGRTESVINSYPVAVGENLADHKAARMACYGKPRGYAEVSFSKDKASTTGAWQHFISGQPFNWITSDAGLYCEFVDTPAVNSVEIRKDNQDDFVQIQNNLLIGWLPSPFSTPYVWHVLSNDANNKTNAWIGMYQFLRTWYCQKTGIKQSVPLPTALYSYLLSDKQIDKTLMAAKKLGFVRCMLPLPKVRHMESLKAPEIKTIYAKMKKNGLSPKPWNPGGYYDSYDHPFVAKHKQYFFYKKNGKFVLYFDKEPVADFNNNEFFEYYKNIVDEAVASGMGGIYLDMAGAYAQLVNYNAKKQEPGLSGLVRLFRYYSTKGINFGIEGQNPLALDNFWYRKNKYVNHSGKEFAFIGMSIYTNPPDHLEMDYFRLGMYNSFFASNISGYAAGMDTAPHEKELTEEIGKLNSQFVKAIKIVGSPPFVQQTSFGTIWTGKKGAALFVWHPVKLLKLNMPDNWKIVDVFSFDGTNVRRDGYSLFNIPHKSIVFIKNNK